MTRAKTQTKTRNVPVPSRLKYSMYEDSVLDGESVVDFADVAFQELRGRVPLSLREDFCGTFQISFEWIRSHPQRTAIALDLDAEPLHYGRTHHLKRLKPEQRRRLTVLQQDVRSVTRPACEVAVAENYSFYALKTRDLLNRYFSMCRRSLTRDGILVLSMAGGYEFSQKHRETRKKKRGKSWYRYVWQHKRYDPVTQEGLWAIHFEMPDGRRYRDAFVYDWRLWGIREVRELLVDAGFADTYVYWEQSDEDGSGNGEYERQETGDNDPSWNVYVVAAR